MTEKLKFGQYCIAIDGSICREDLSNDGLGILCNKHVNRICAGEHVELTSRARPPHEAALEHLHKQLWKTGIKGKRPRDGIADDPTQNRKKPEETKKGDNSGPALNLLSFSIISAVLTIYAALFVWVQAKSFDIPLGLALSGFNATTVAIQSVPQAITLLAIGLMVLLLLGLVVVAFAFVATSIAAGLAQVIRIMQPVLYVSSLLLSFPGWIARSFGYRSLEKLETAHDSLVTWTQKIADTSDTVWERSKHLARYVVNLARTPYYLIVWGDLPAHKTDAQAAGLEHRVARARLTAFAVLLVSSIALVWISSIDRDRRIYRLANDCGDWDLPTACQGLNPNIFLDWIDPYVPAPTTLASVMANDTWPGMGREFVSWAAVGARGIFSPKPVSGTFAYSAPNGGTNASHIVAEQDTVQSKSFRTEELIHVGDFGEWFYVARKNDVNNRILLKRSAVTEFAAGTGAQAPSFNAVYAKLKASLGAEILRGESLQAALAVANAEIARLKREGEDTKGEALPRIAAHTSVAVVPLVQTNVNSEPSEPLTREAILDLTDGLPNRAMGVFDDLVRTYGPEVIRACRKTDGTVPPVLFENGKAVWNSIEASAGRQSFDDAVQALTRHLRDRATQGLEIVLLEGSTSYTGTPERNLELSEKRAEQVKADLLAALLPGATGDQADLAAKAITDLRLHLVSYGFGEVLETEANAGRTVTIRICDPLSKTTTDDALEEFAANDKALDDTAPTSVSE